jgi:hypothetical protein
VKTTPNPISACWGRLPGADHPVWHCAPKEETKLNRRREQLELLCAGLWHLELLFELGPVAEGTVEEPQGRGNPTLWRDWTAKRSGVSVCVDAQKLSIRFGFSDLKDEPGHRLLMQCVLLGNAALRLDGVRELLKIECPRLSRHALAGSLDNETFAITGTERDPMVRDLLLVTAFRDSFMHGERPDTQVQSSVRQCTGNKPPIPRGVTPDKKLREFRNRWIGGLQLSELVQSCAGASDRLLELVTMDLRPKS